MLLGLIGVDIIGPIPLVQVLCNHLVDEVESRPQICDAANGAVFSCEL